MILIRGNVEREADDECYVAEKLMKDGYQTT